MAAATVALAVLLSGCADDDAPRDAGNQVTAPATAGVLTVRVGDCVGDIGAGDIGEVDEIPCTQPHEYEVFSAKLLADGEFPGPDAVEKARTDFCRAEFTGFVGTEYDSSDLDMKTLAPSTETWVAGDREILCLVGVGGGSQSTGSLRGAQR